MSGGRKHYTWTGHGLVGLLLVSFLISWYWLVPNSGAEADAAVYLLAGKNIARTGDAAHGSADPLVFVPEHMVEVRPGVFYPIYPPGYPALNAAAFAVGGVAAPFYLNPLLFLAGLVGAFFLARRFLDDVLALGITAFLALHPALLYYAVIPMSHAAEFALATWCLYFVVGWYQKGRLWMAVGAAVLVGAAITVRYTGGLLALPLGYVLAVRILGLGEGGISRRKALVHGGLALVAGVVSLVPLGVYQAHAFGAPWRTGYGLTGESGAFSLGHLVAHGPYALKALCQMPLGLFVLFPMALGGIGWLLRRRPALGGLLSISTMPTLVVYAAYYWFIADPTPWWQPVSTGSLLYVRFFLGTFPMLLIGAVVALEALLVRSGNIRREMISGVIAGVLLLMGVVNVAIFPRWSQFLGSAAQDDAAMRLVKAHVPKDAAIVADGYAAYSLVCQTDMTVYYPRYFARKWVNERLAPGSSAQPADYDRLRRERFAEAVGDRADDDLLDLLRQRLVAHARAGRSVWLLTRASAPPWHVPLQDAFAPVPVAEDLENQWVLWRLNLR